MVMLKRVLVINPNTSVEMTEDIRKTLDRIKETDVEITVTKPDFGARSLESFYDYSLASFGCIRLVNKIGKNYDGILLACFGDPGLYAMKEIYEYPVIGIAEASMAMSTLMGQKFSLLVASDKAVPMMADMVNQYGLNSRLASIEPLGMNVLELEKNRQESIEQLIVVGKRAIEKGAEVLILGCAGMTGMKEDIQAALGVPIIDPVEYGYKVLEMMVKNNFSISKIGLYGKPYEKEIVKSELLSD